MNTANKEVRNEAKKKKIKLYEIARRADMTDTAFSRRMRNELPQEEKEIYLKLINELYSEKHVPKVNKMYANNELYLCTITGAFDKAIVVNKDGFTVDGMCFDWKLVKLIVQTAIEVKNNV